MNMHAVRRGHDGSLPLANYAALGDGRTVALVALDGSIDWLCLPAFDSLPIFNRLIDSSEGGYFSLAPQEEFTVARRYLDGSNVLETEYRTKTGRVRVTESLNSSQAGRLPWSELARLVEGLEGTVSLRLILKFNHMSGSATPWKEVHKRGPIFHLNGLMTAFLSSDDVSIRSENSRSLEAELVTTQGSRSMVVLVGSQNTPTILPSLSDIERRLRVSDAAWRQWSDQIKVDGPYEGAIRRSALALKLLLFSPTGAVVAAGTMSLPESLGGPKNYDYRYGWIRDTAYTIKAFVRIGATEEAQAGLAWLLRLTERWGVDLSPLYTLRCEPTPDVKELPLAGYRGSKPVQTGNAASKQQQLNVYGDILETAYVFVQQGHVLDLQSSESLSKIANACADRWRQPDSGIWELPEQQHYTFSKIGCWLALDRAARLAEQGCLNVRFVHRWRCERDCIREWIDTHCWSDKRKAYTQYPGSDKLDASLLLASRFQFPSADRLRATRDAVRRELARGPLVYRYSGMDKEEGAFLACSFWLVEALAFLGDRSEAEKVLAELTKMTGCNHGLLNEMMDPKTKEMLGNMPQALSHLAMIHAALSLNETASAPK